MIRATAVGVIRFAAPGYSSEHRYGWALIDGPHAGITFVASDRPTVGEAATVEYHPDDQFAHRAR